MRLAGVADVIIPVLHAAEQLAAMSDPLVLDRFATMRTALLFLLL
jgi:hypothetical protein